MSTYRVCAMADRVVLIHDLADRTVHSELDAEQADMLLQQLQQALEQSLTVLRATAGDVAAR